MMRTISTVRAYGLALAVGCGLLSGCVERRFVITSDPPGAIVYNEHGQPIGATPVDREFTYYGKYKHTLVHDGCQTVMAVENVRAPWYGVCPMDFVSEVLLPWRFRDIRRLHYVLPPQQIIPAEVLLDEAHQMQRRGRAIHPPDILGPPQLVEPVVVPPAP